jgi:Tol biopolymer transport system component/predicted Ser/Thr protein kinase
MIGRTVTHYRIIEKLGQGGMGEVYLAEDTRLRRKISLKFLPRHLTTDNEARERFEREARAAAALNHPNIITIHEINEHDGQVYIAMEYVAGETLREKMNRESPLTPETAVDIVRQVCNGLDKAHRAGIVHRDLKPENIMLDADGRVKILDFGLAKLKGVTRLTRESLTPGTIYYMSPEQARGDDVDAGTDIWSLGVMLYEMLAGCPPFRGEFDQAVVYSIMNEDPAPVGDLSSDIPASLEFAVNRALKKNRNERFPDVSALRDVIDSQSHTDGPASRRTRPGLTNKVFASIATLIGLGVIFLAISYFFKQHKTPQYVPPEYQQVTFTGDCGVAALSLDGNYIAYSSKQGDTRGIFMKDLRSGSAVCVYTAPRCWVFDWAPDGSRLLFSSFTNDSTTGTFIVPRLGGGIRRIHERPWPYFAWSPDGRRIAHVGVGDGTVDVIDLDNNDTRSFELGPDVGEVVSLDWSAARDELLIQADDTESHVFWAVRPDASQKRVVWQIGYNTGAPVGHPWWSPDGNTIYFFSFGLRGQALWDLKKLPVDEKTGTAAGEPVVVLNSLQLFSLDASVTHDGKHLLYTRATEHSNLWLVRINGEKTHRTTNKTQLTRTTSWKSRAQISPDGKKIVFAMSEGDASNIYTLSLPQDPGTTPPTSPKQLTFFSSLNDLPVWSPDGKEIVFLSSQGGAPAIWRMGANGESPRQFDNTSVNYQDGDYITWAPGPEIIYRSKGVRNFLVLNPRSGEEHPLVEDELAGYIFGPCWSPDGGQIVMFWNRDNQVQPSMDLWVLSPADNTRRVIADGIYNPVAWSSDGKWIYAVDYGVKESNALYRIPVSGGEPELYVNLPFDDVRSDRFSITPDGRKVVYAEVITSSDAWIIDNFDPEIE